MAEATFLLSGNSRCLVATDVRKNRSLPRCSSQARSVRNLLQLSLYPKGFTPAVETATYPFAAAPQRRRNTQIVKESGFPLNKAVYRSLHEGVLRIGRQQCSSLSKGKPTTKRQVHRIFRILSLWEGEGAKTHRFSMTFCLSQQTPAIPLPTGADAPQRRQGSSLVAPQFTATACCQN